MLCFLLLVMASWPWRTWAAQDSSHDQPSLTASVAVVDSGAADILQTETNSASTVTTAPPPSQSASPSVASSQASVSSSSTSSLSSPTQQSGLAKLAATLEQEDASKKMGMIHKPVKYASGLWITTSSQSSHHGKPNQGSRRQKRSIDLEEEAAAAIAAAETGPRYLHHHNSPWKRRSRMNHQSSSISKQSEKQHYHVPSSLSSSKSSTSSAPNPSSSFSSDNNLDPEPLTGHLRAAGRDMAMHMMKKRRMNGGRMYDVPQIECPRSEDRMERFACPSPDFRGRYRCIDDRSLCDGFFDCPSREDENPDMCLFYKTTKAHLDILAEALLRWARGR